MKKTANIKKINLPPGQIIYQRSISSVYSLRHWQIETTDYTVFSSQPKVGSDIRANHMASHSRDVTTDIYIFNILNSYFFIYLSCFVYLYIYLIHLFIYLFIYLFIIFHHPPSAVRFLLLQTSVLFSCTSLFPT